MRRFGLARSAIVLWLCLLASSAMGQGFSLWLPDSTTGVKPIGSRIVVVNSPGASSVVQRWKNAAGSTQVRVEEGASSGLTLYFGSASTVGIAKGIGSVLDVTGSVYSDAYNTDGSSGAQAYTCGVTGDSGSRWNVEFDGTHVWGDGSTDQVSLDLDANHLVLNTQVAGSRNFEILAGAPSLGLHNSTHEDTDGGRESQILFKGEQSGGEESTLVKLQASHDGTGDDQKGDFIVYVNDGDDGDSPTEGLRIDSQRDVTLSGQVDVSKNTANDAGIFITVEEAGNSVDVKLGALKSGDGSYTLPGIWFDQASPSLINYTFQYSPTIAALFNVPTNYAMKFRINNVDKMIMNSSGDFGLVNDNAKLYRGAGNDVSDYYDGSNWIFDSQEVGSGDFYFKSGNLGVHTATARFPLTIVESGVTPETSQVIGDDSRSISIQGDGAAYFMGRDVTNDIEFIMGSSASGGAFAGAMSSHDFWLRTDNVTRITIKTDTGYVGFGGETAPETLTEWTSTTPYLTLHNSTEEDGDGGRESRFIFKGEQSGTEETTLGIIEVSHDGAVDDQKGKLIVKLNDGDDGDSPTERFRIDSAGAIGATAALTITAGTPAVYLTDTSGGEDDWGIYAYADHLYFKNMTSGVDRAILPGTGGLVLAEQSADPAAPAEGTCVVWMSDGTGKGDDGDVLIASQAGGTTKYTTLFDHSAGDAF